MTAGTDHHGAMPPLVPPVVPVGALAGSQQPVLETRDGGLRLRPWLDTDAHVLVDAFDDPQIQRWHRRRLHSAQEACELIAAWNQCWRVETDGYWAIVDVATGTVLGRASLREVRLNEGVAECAYWVLPTARDGGVATRAVVELSRWALEELGLHRLELAHSVRNRASCRVADKAGYPLEGTKRSALLHRDGWHDMHLHARVRDERHAES